MIEYYRVMFADSDYKKQTKLSIILFPSERKQQPYNLDAIAAYTAVTSFVSQQVYQNEEQQARDKKIINRTIENSFANGTLKRINILSSIKQWFQVPCHTSYTDHISYHIISLTQTSTRYGNLYCTTLAHDSQCHLFCATTNCCTMCQDGIVIQCTYTHLTSTNTSTKTLLIALNHGKFHQLFHEYMITIGSKKKRNPRSDHCIF